MSAAAAEALAVESAGPGAPQVWLAVEDPAWAEALGGEDAAAALIARAAAAAFAAAGLDPAGWAVSALLAADAEVAELNRDHRGKEGPTNVLSWPAYDLAPEAGGAVPPPPPAPELMPGEEAEAIGDLAFAFGVCRAEAEAGGIPFADHVTHLALHGTLHCLGFDHISDADAELMERLESGAMLAMGLADPYLARDG